MASKPPKIRKARPPLPPKMRKTSVFDSHHAPSTQSAMCGAEMFSDPTAHEGLCPLCGRWMCVSAQGYCGTEECSEAILEYAKRERPDAILRVSGMNMLLLGKLHRYAAPDVESVKLKSHKQDRDGTDILCGVSNCSKCAKIPATVMVKEVSDANLCKIPGCNTFAKPRDTLCNQHRRENPKMKNRHMENRVNLGNRIKGLSGLKLR